MAKNTKTILVSIFLAFIMVTSIIGFYFGTQGSATTIRYNGITFTQELNGWNAKIDGQQYRFSYVPQDVEGLPFPEMALNGAVQIGLTTDINATTKEDIAIAMFELQTILTQAGIYVAQGFTTNDTLLPKITCADSTSTVPVIYYQYGEETNVTKEGNCVAISSYQPYFYLSYSDLIAYKALGVLP